MFSSLGLRIAEVLRHHEQRERTIIRAISGGLKTAYQIAEEIPWMLNMGDVAFNDLAPWNRRLAVQETLAYLRLSTLEGRAGKLEKDGISLYLAKE